MSTFIFDALILLIILQNFYLSNNFKAELLLAMGYFWYYYFYLSKKVWILLLPQVKMTCKFLFLNGLTKFLCM